MIVRALLKERVAGVVNGNCVDVAGLVSAESAQEPCWIRCRDGRRVVDHELDTAAVRLVNPVAGTSGWGVDAAVDYEHPDGTVTRAIESWELTELDDGRLAVTRVDAVLTTDVGRKARRTVVEYLYALADKRYEDAADLLQSSGLDYPQRLDLRPLPGFPEFPDGVAAALAQWCRQAICERPVAIAVEPVVGGIEADVTATYDVEGGTVTATFMGYLDEGTPRVMGIAPERP